NNISSHLHRWPSRTFITMISRYALHSLSIPLTANWPDVFGDSPISLSFGQKRLLSYLYYLECNTEIGAADELMNGMHHEWIEHCMVTACENRQMFYTSQNPLLLDFLEFGSETEVSERFVTCKWNDQDGFVWENLEPRIGQEFYRLYKAGL